MGNELHVTETITATYDTKLQRITVPGGWIYMLFTTKGQAMQFVPEIWKEDV